MHTLLTLALLLAATLTPQGTLAQTTMTGGDGVGKIPYFTCPSKGEMRFPVIIVTYQDVPLSDTDENVMQHFDDFFNKTGYNHNGATGSVRDYFLYASAGRFSPRFDVLGVVPLKNERAYYGEGLGTAAGHPDEMVIEAVAQLGDKVDFSVYDSNADGYVDDVIVIYAGNAERFDAPDSAVLPTSFLISFNKYGVDGFTYGYEMNGLRFDSYTVTSETAYGKYDGIGTFLHEFSHGLGLADLYNIYDTRSNYTPMTYDLMDIGLYNNNSNTPPTYSAFERYALGWTDLEVIDMPGEFTLEPIGLSNKAYIVPVTQSEFFILENRQQQDWDAHIPGHGLIVWHIDYDAQEWYNNTANYTSSHQRIDLIEACGKVGKTTSVQRGYPFPGSGNVQQLTLTPWKATTPLLTISDITESNGNISFRVSDVTGISTPQGSANVKVEGHTLTAPTSMRIVDTTGRSIGTGQQVKVSSSGIYIVTTATTTQKVAVN